MYQVYQDYQRRMAVEVDENPQYRRFLCVADSGVVDVIKKTTGQMERDGWTPYAGEFAALHYAYVFAKSTLVKTPSAAREMIRIIGELEKLPANQLGAAYTGMTGLGPVKFRTRQQGLEVISQAVRFNNVIQPQEQEHDMAPIDQATSKQTTKKTTPVKKAKAAPAKAVKKNTSGPKPGPTPSLGAALAKAVTNGAKPAPKKSSKAVVTKAATKVADNPVKKAKGVDPVNAKEKAKNVCKSDKGSGGLIRKLIMEGKLDTEQILSRVLKEYPERNTKASDVSWNRGMLRKAGLLKD